MNNLHPKRHWILLFKGHYGCESDNMFVSAATSIGRRAGYLSSENPEELIVKLSEVAFEATYGEAELFLTMFRHSYTSLRETINHFLPYSKENDSNINPSIIISGEEQSTISIETAQNRAKMIFYEQIVRMLGITISLSWPENRFNEIGEPSTDIGWVVNPRKK